MKKWFVSFMLLFVLALSSFAVTADASSFKQVKQVSGSSLVVKAHDYSSAKTLFTLKQGTYVTVLSSSYGWDYIEVNGKKGYANSSFLAKPASKIKIASSKGGLVVKASPSRAAKTTATLKYNMIVEDYGSVGGGWSLVQYGNVIGYVSSSFINVAKTKTMYVDVGTGYNLIVRNIASASGEQVATLANQTKVTVHSTLAGWSYVTAGSTKGYVVASYLNAKGPITQVTGGLFPNCGKSILAYNHVSNYGGETASYYCSKVGSAYYVHPYKGTATSEFYFNYSFGKNQMNINFPEGIYEIKFPLTVGKSWFGFTSHMGIATYTVESLTETVVTNAGTYKNVVKIRLDEGYTDYDSGRNVYTGEQKDLYLAPGVGILKMESDYITTTLYNHY